MYIHTFFNFLHLTRNIIISFDFSVEQYSVVLKVAKMMLIKSPDCYRLALCAGESWKIQPMWNISSSTPHM